MAAGGCCDDCLWLHTFACSATSHLYACKLPSEAKGCTESKHNLGSLLPLLLIVLRSGQAMPRTDGWRTQVRQLPPQAMQQPTAQLLAGSCVGLSHAMGLCHKPMLLAQTFAMKALAGALDNQQGLRFLLYTSRKRACAARATGPSRLQQQPSTVLCC